MALGPSDPSFHQRERKSSPDTSKKIWIRECRTEDKKKKEKLYGRITRFSFNWHGDAKTSGERVILFGRANAPHCLTELLAHHTRQPWSRQSKVREKPFFTAIVKSLIKHDATWRHPCRNAAKQISKNGTQRYETIWRRTLNNTKRYEQEKKTQPYRCRNKASIIGHVNKTGEGQK